VEYSAQLRVVRAMADILILFPPDKKGAAQQIFEALKEARFASRLEPLDAVGGETALKAAEGAGAAILIWSRGLAASAVMAGWLGPLRRLPHLTEVSTDGIAPQGGDESRVILLSGWRGQPFHLGWQRIVGELERSGVAARRAEAVRPARGAALPPRKPGAKEVAEAQPAGRSAGAGAGAAGRMRRFVLPAAAAAALIGALGAAAWVEDQGSPRAQTSGRNGVAVTAATPAPGSRPQPANADMPGDGGLPLTSPGDDFSEVEADAAAPVAVAGAAAPLGRLGGPSRDGGAGAAPARAAVTAIPARVAAAPSRQTAKAKAVQTSPVVKRYSRKNSKKMRRFCERAGRGTPECRVFARSTASRSR
jgi:hypothetical protein